jgi:uncharacterized protein YndB with AHSA1/START domain
MTHRVTVRRQIEASPEELFDAWLEAEWLAPRDGVYLAVERPHRLVFTWRSAITNHQETTVTVHFRPVGERTEVAITHGN